MNSCVHNPTFSITRKLFQNMINIISTCFWVQLKTNKNCLAKLFEFVFIGVEILGTFHGFIHIRNLIFQNMDGILFLENWNLNL
jgi:hypothetical protein